MAASRNRPWFKDGVITETSGRGRVSCRGARRWARARAGASQGAGNSAFAPKRSSAKRANGHLSSLPPDLQESEGVGQAYPWHLPPFEHLSGARLPWPVMNPE